MKIKIRNPKESTDKEVDVEETTTIGDLQKICTPLFQADPSTIKFIFQAKILNPASSMADNKIGENSVVMINFKKTQQAAASPAHQQNDPIVEGKPQQTQSPQQPQQTQYELVEYFPKDYQKMITPTKKQKDSVQVPAVRTPSQPTTAQPQIQAKSAAVFGKMPPQMVFDITQNPMNDAYSHQLLKDKARCEKLLANPNIQKVMQSMCGGDPRISAIFASPKDAFNLIKQSQCVFRKNGTVDGAQNVAGRYTFMDDNDEDLSAKSRTDEQSQINQSRLQQGAQQSQQLTTLSRDELLQKWSTQLETIRNMGVDAPEDEILRMLELYGGNIEMVINVLLGM